MAIPLQEALLKLPSVQVCKSSIYWRQLRRYQRGLRGPAGKMLIGVFCCFFFGRQKMEKNIESAAGKSTHFWCLSWDKHQTNWRTFQQTIFDYRVRISNLPVFFSSWGLFKTTPNWGLFVFTTPRIFTSCWCVCSGSGSGKGLLSAGRAADILGSVGRFWPINNTYAVMQLYWGYLIPSGKLT